MIPVYRSFFFNDRVSSSVYLDSEDFQQYFFSGKHIFGHVIDGLYISLGVIVVVLAFNFYTPWNRPTLINCNIPKHQLGLFVIVDVMGASCVYVGILRSPVQVSKIA